MTWDLVGLILKEHGIYVFAITVIGWAYWQERKQNMKNAEDERAESKTMIAALVEVKNALQQFKENLETRFPKR
jgi:cbb3-type cytochrome oxidase subunit 3